MTSAAWLPRIVSWFVDVHLDDGVNPDPEEEEKDITSQIQGLYAAAQDGVRSSQQVLMISFGVSLLLTGDMLAAEHNANVKNLWEAIRWSCR